MDDKKRLGMLSVPLLAVTGLGLGMWVFAMVALGKPAWGIFLANFLFFTSVSQGVLAAAIILRITSAKWSAGLFRLASTATLSFAPVVLIMLVFIFISRGAMFYWVGEAEHNLWYNSIFFIVRNLVPLIGFYALARSLALVGKNASAGGSFDNEAHGQPEFKHDLLRLGFFTLVFFVLYQTVMAWDLGMILNHGFADTAYAPIFIIGSVYAGVAALVLLMAGAKRFFGSVGFSDLHFSSLGQLLLGLSLFWIYAWYTQFFSIWFVNLPEETGPIYLRIFHGYGAIYVAALVFTGFLPFAMLLLTKIRESSIGVTIASASILTGIWLDRYLIAVPPLIEAKRTAPMSLINPANILFSVGVLALFTFLLVLAVGRSKGVIYTSEAELKGELLISEPTGWQ